MQLVEDVDAVLNEGVQLYYTQILLYEYTILLPYYLWVESAKKAEEILLEGVDLGCTIILPYCRATIAPHNRIL